MAKQYVKREMIIEGVCVFWVVEYLFHDPHPFVGPPDHDHNYVVCWCDFESDADKIIAALRMKEPGD